MKNSITKLTFLAILISTALWACSSPEKDLEIDDILMEITVREIHDYFSRGDLTAEQLVQAYLKRINHYDKSTDLNSIVVINPNALEEAKILDEEYRRTGNLRPLHGIPLIVKDNYLTAGLQSAAGSIALKGFAPDIDAFQVSKLREAGCVILAKSNMAEWAFSPAVSISSILGETRNPYNLDHVPAGSSGGTAAAVAANFATLGLGTDTGNSIRGPSSHNSLVGFRSTLGLTSRHGIFPLYVRNDVGGPMCRTVEDAARILQVIDGYDPADPVTAHSRGKERTDYLAQLDPDGLQDARIGVLRLLSERDHDSSIHILFEQAIKDLHKLGAEIIDPIDVPDFDSLRSNLWCPVFQHDINAFFDQLGDQLPVKNIREVVSSGQYSGYIEQRLNYFLENPEAPEDRDPPCLDPFEDTRRVAFRTAIEEAMDAMHVDALIYPSWNFPPAKIGDTEGYRGDNSQLIAPHTGQPAFTIPMGHTSGNLPAGIQFLGRMFDEATLVRLAYAYEQGTKHRMPPGAFPALKNQ